MTMPNELPLHLEKLYELVYQQVKADLEKQGMSVHSDSKSTSGQHNELFEQLQEMKRKYDEDTEQYYRQLQGKEKQLADLQIRYEKLSKSYQIQYAQLQELEQDKHRLHEKLQDNQDNNSGYAARLTEKLEELQAELDASNTNYRVLKHHYSEMERQRSEQKELLERAKIKADKLQRDYEEKMKQFSHLEKEYCEVEELNKQHMEEIAKQKRDLMMVMDNYYDGILHKDKKVSKNLPR